MKITPCCKTKRFNPTVESNFDTMFRCLVCDKKWDYEQLIEVQNGFNPTTFYCDKCHKSLEDEI